MLVFALRSQHWVIHEFPLLLSPGMGEIWWGTRGTLPPTFSDGGHNMPCPPHIFLFRFCIWRGFKNKSDASHVLCEELFMLDGRPHVAKFMLKQSLVWYHWILLVYTF